MDKDERSAKMWEEHPIMPTRSEIKRARFVKMKGFSAIEKAMILRERARIEKEKKKDEKRKREEMVIHLRLDREMSFKDIAEVLGVTTQRVQQIVQRLQKEEGVYLARIKKAPMPKQQVKTHCKTCGVEFEIVKSQYKGEGRHNCKSHRHVAKIIYPDWLKGKSQYQHNKWRYHNDPEFKEKRLTATKAYAKRMMRERNPRYIERQRQAVKRYIEKNKNNPVWVEKQQVRSHLAYLKNRNKPGWKEKERERGLRYRMKKKLEQGW